MGGMGVRFRLFLNYCSDNCESSCHKHVNKKTGETRAYCVCFDIIVHKFILTSKIDKETSPNARANDGMLYY